MAAYIISIDQSTQGTKALLFDENGQIVRRTDCAHRQIINEKGWVSHDPEEIYQNVLKVTQELLDGIDKSCVAGVGISNQRETTLAWNRISGKPYGQAVVWQCARASQICERESIKLLAEKIRQKTGMNLSPYFPAAKLAWLLENEEGAMQAAQKHEICHGTIDSWLVYKLTGKKEYRTDYSNASRTQLFNIFELKWDKELCYLFGIDPTNLAEVTDSDACFGETDFEGLLPKKVPIHSVMGDSHGALLGQGCLQPGSIKATYGTGSSIMMNIGEKPIISTHGVVTSLAWKIGGSVKYVLEGNLNYTGAVITWLKDDLELIGSASETEDLARRAIKEDKLYLVPAFSGLGAPYWDSKAKASIVGMSRTTKKAEFVRAALECIAYQITDIVNAMSEDAEISVKQLCVDGGPTRNSYLMQFQSDILGASVLVPNAEELSAIGPAYAAGYRLGLWGEEIFTKLQRTSYKPCMEENIRKEKYSGWKNSLSLLRTDNLPPAVSPAYFGIKKAFSSHKIKRRKGFSSVVPLLFIRHPADALIRFCNGNSRFCLSWIIPVQQKNSKVSSESMILPLTTRQLSEIRRIFLLVLFFAFAIY